MSTLFHCVDKGNGIRRSLSRRGKPSLEIISACQTIDHPVAGASSLAVAPKLSSGCHLDLGRNRPANADSGVPSKLTVCFMPCAC
ncbi:hypothetical protein [Bradyrhizobium icense]|uniref:hypothetical protein n=1 Tax=Bradyrhizobium icense TaxID=1274631 RepID=UPI0012EABEB9|nr:hypothetical protein [Bradyrhizobium icense]